MSNIGDAMKNKGYMPLVDNGVGGMGWTPKIGGKIMRLGKPVWFDIGQKIKDAEGRVHPMTVAAYDSVQYEEYLKKGWKVVDPETRSWSDSKEEGIQTEIKAKKRARNEETGN